MTIAFYAQVVFVAIAIFEQTCHNLEPSLLSLFDT